MLCNPTSLLLIGMVDTANLLYTHEATGEQLTLLDAIQQAYLKGTEASCKAAIQEYILRNKPAIMEYTITRVRHLQHGSYFIMSLVRLWL